MDSLPGSEQQCSLSTKLNIFCLCPKPFLIHSCTNSSSTSSQFTSFSSQSQPIHPCHLPSPPCPSLFNTAWLHSLQQKFSCPAFPKLLLCFSFSSSHKLLVPSFPLYLSLGISVLVRPVPAP